MKLPAIKKQSQSKNTTGSSIPETVTFLESNKVAGFKPELEIYRVELVPAIYPRQIEVGKMYEGKNEIIEKIVESGVMVHIYTHTSGVKYGTPICICKKDIQKLIYG